MSGAEIRPSNDQWRARYGKLDRFAVAPFLEYRSAPLSDEGWRLTSLTRRAIHRRLPIMREIREEVVFLLGAMADGDRYAKPLHKQKLVALRIGINQEGRFPASGASLGVAL